MKKQLKVDLIKAHEELGMLFGYAVICLDNGKPYFDLQGDYIPEDVMLRAALDFMSSYRYAYDSHIYGIGTVIFAWPMTTEIAAAMDITVSKTGLLVGIKVDNDDIISRFRQGIYTGFSIGGVVNQSEMVDESEESIE